MADISGAEPACKPIEEKDKIGILMQEYSTLRAEMLLHLGAMKQFAIITFNATIASSTVIGATRSALQGAIAFAILITFMGIIFWIQSANIARLGRRLRDLEKEVNDRVGEPLLKWERNYVTTPLKLLRRIQIQISN
jgi:hypothetical protein